MKNRAVDSLTTSIIKTLSYADIFNYPLMLSELTHYLHTPVTVSEKTISQQLQYLSSIISSHNDFLYFKGRGELVSLRKKRMNISKDKFKKAKKIAVLLSFIPSIQLIGISGSLSMNNCEAKDDIDFIFITAPHTIWFSRLLVYAILRILRISRARNTSITEDKICPNMFLSSEALELPDKNIYIAHEIAQLKVLYNNKNIYQEFMVSNKWIRRYLANVQIEKYKHIQHKPLSINIFMPLIICIESCMYWIQNWYMSSHITDEVITKKSARFHSQQRAKKIYQSYLQRTQEILKNLRKIEKQRCLYQKSTRNKKYHKSLKTEYKTIRLLTPGY